MFVIKAGQVCANWISKIFDKFKDGIGDFFSSAVEIFLSILFMPIYMIFTGLAQIADIIQYFFKKLAGMGGIYMDGEYVEGDIALAIFQNPTIKQAFISMLVLGGVLLFAFTFISVIKTAWAKDTAGSSPWGPVKAAFRSIVNFVTVPTVCILGIIVGNELLKAVDLATAPAHSETFSGRIFVSMAYNANRARYKDGDFYNEYINKKNVGLRQESEKYNNNFGIFIDSVEDGTFGQAADLIDQHFAAGSSMLIPMYGAYGGELVPNPATHLIISGGAVWGGAGAGLGMGLISGLLVGTTAGGLTSSDIFSDNIFVDEDFSTYYYLTFYDLEQVATYYDLSSMNYLLGIGGLIAVLWVFLSVIMGLIKRVFMIVGLLIISPPIVAMGPIDGGKALGSWRSAFVSNTLSAYGAIVAFNIYFLILGVINQIDFISTPDGLGLIGGFINIFFSLFFMLGGALFFKDLVSQISGLVGAGNAYADGSGKAKAALDLGVKGASFALSAGAIPMKGLKNADSILKSAFTKDEENLVSLKKFNRMSDEEKASFKQKDAEQYNKLSTRANRESEIQTIKDYLNKPENAMYYKPLKKFVGMTDEEKAKQKDFKKLSQLEGYFDKLSTLQKADKLDRKEYNDLRIAKAQDQREGYKNAVLKNSIAIDAGRRIVNNLKFNIEKSRDTYKNFGLSDEEKGKRENKEKEYKELVKAVKEVEQKEKEIASKALKDNDFASYNNHLKNIESITNNFKKGVYSSTGFADVLAKLDSQKAETTSELKRLYGKLNELDAGTEQYKTVSTSIKKLETELKNVTEGINEAFIKGKKK